MTVENLISKKHWVMVRALVHSQFTRAGFKANLVKRALQEHRGSSKMNEARSLRFDPLRKAQRRWTLYSAHISASSDSDSPTSARVPSSIVGSSGLVDTLLPSSPFVIPGVSDPMKSTLEGAWFSPRAQPFMTVLVPPSRPPPPESPTFSESFGLSLAPGPPSRSAT